MKKLALLTLIIFASLIFAPTAVMTAYTADADQPNNSTTATTTETSASDSTTKCTGQNEKGNATPEGCDLNITPSSLAGCTESNTSLACTTLDINYNVTALCEGFMNTTERQTENEKELEKAEKNEPPSSTGDPDNCGVANNSGYFEKGDCSPQYDNYGTLTKKGYVITEVTEIIGEDTSVDDNRIVTLYKGTCCVTTNELTNNCVETSYVYAKDYATCEGKGKGKGENSAINCQKIQWIIGSSGAGILKVYVKQIYGWAAGTIGFIVVVTIIINGIRISVSGVSGDITTAKDNILKAISALVLLFLSGLLLYTINPTFFG